MRSRCLYTYLIAFSSLLCSFSTIIFAQDSQRPALLTSFNAGLFNNSAVQLSWTADSLSEDSVDFFIERSRNGIVFQLVGKITAGKAGVKEFKFTDNLPLTDSGFYRLSWTDREGIKQYSQAQKVQFPVKPRSEISIMPNPVFNNACLIINHEELGEISCVLFDMSGKSIRSYQVKKTMVYMQHILDMYSVPKGEYILSIRGNTINESKRIVKQ